MVKNLINSEMSRYTYMMKIKPSSQQLLLVSSKTTHFLPQCNPIVYQSMLSYIQKNSGKLTNSRFITSFKQIEATRAIVNT